MFSVREVKTAGGVVQYRTELHTQLRCRVSTERIKRGIGGFFPMVYSRDDCPFCPDMIKTSTPTFEDGTRLSIGESTTFPNLFPFAERHIVTVITRAHEVDRFTKNQLIDALRGQLLALETYDGYPSINWNYLPSAGASLVHPHLQGIADRLPGALTERYLLASHRYLLRNGELYQDALLKNELSSERYLFGDEIPWIASAVPLGEREIRGYLPVSTLPELEPYLDVLADGILKVIELYRFMGTSAYNMGIFFDKCSNNSGFRAFCSMIARINPNPHSLVDSAFMERLHLEPLILTLPEEIGTIYRKSAL